MKNSTVNDFSFYRTLFGCGVFLAATEIAKQLVLAFIVEPGAYDWWYFPFQLCSIPMYLCLLLPWMPKNMRTIFCTFMQDFNLLGGAAALIVSDGFPRSHWYLSLHAYVWHILLLYIGMYVALSGRVDNSSRGYYETLPLFTVCCAIATIINVLAPDNRADMFYISPYHPSEQLLFHEIGVNWGILPGHLLYLFSICLGAYILHVVFRRYMEKRKNA